MSIEAYEVGPRKDKCGFDLISDTLPFGRLWYGARIVFDCRMANDPAMMSSTISVHFTMNDIWETARYGYLKEDSASATSPMARNILI
jgi:hypothetical protein